MFSKEFLNTLAKLNNYTDKVVLKYPTTTINSDARDVLINIKSDILGCQEFPETGVYELSKLINILNLFETPEIQRVDRTLEIQSVTESAVFTLCDLDLLSGYNQKDSIIGSLDKFPNIAEFELTQEALTHFKKAASILNELNAFRIKGINGNTLVDLTFNNKFNSSNNTYKREYLGTSSKGFELNLDIENIQKLPLNNYKVKVKYNAEKDATRVLFETETYSILIANLVS